MALGVEGAEGMFEGEYEDVGEGDEYGDEGEGQEEGGIPLEGNNLFQALAQNPNFALIRQRILQDQTFYPQFLEQLAQSQPALYQMIQQNPAAFMNLILAGDPNTGLPSGFSQGQD
jgi:hypothetical protein